MKIVYSRLFQKRFKKLDSVLKKKVTRTIKEFTKDPNRRSLKNHKLTGKLKDMRSISVTGDVRIIFEEKDGYTLVIFLDVGGHGSVYK